MSQEEIQALEAQEQELKEKLEAMRIKKQSLIAEEVKRQEEEKREEELKKEILVEVTQRQSGTLLVQALSRPDLLEVWRSVPGRSYKGLHNRYEFETNGKEAPGINLIPIKEWEECEKKLSALPRLEIKYHDGVREDIEWYLSAPNWFVDIAHIRGAMFFVVKKGPGVSHYGSPFAKIPGSSWEWERGCYEIPGTEAWRIFPACEGVEGIVYSEAARQVIVEQIENRAMLDQIVGQEDSQDPRIYALDRTVWNNRMQEHQPFWEYLKPYQRVGVEFLLTTGGRCILADDTGLGKTAQLIAFSEIKRKENPDLQTVFSVKAGSIPNWRREVMNLTGEDPVICTNLNGKKMKAIGMIMKGAPYIIISHDLMGTYDKNDEENNKDEKKDYEWVEIFRMLSINTLGLDEAHQIRNLNTHRSRSHRRLKDVPNILPATASPVINRTEEFWPLLNLVDPLNFPSQQVFNSAYTQWGEGKLPDNIEQLHEMLRPRFIRRKRSDVDKDMEEVNRVTNISPISDQARADYENVLAGIYRKLELFDPEGKGGEYLSVPNILAEITRLKQICAAEKVPFTAELAQELVADEPADKKVLIFSQFKPTAYAIAQALGNEAVCTVEKYEDKRGELKFNSMNSVERDNLFESTRGNPEIRYVVTTEAAKETHNIEYCWWVIFNDQFWSPEAHKQAEGRAHYRTNNPHPIDAFYQIADVDIEQWLQELLDGKFHIIESTVEGVELSRDVTGSVGAELIKRLKKEMYTRKK